MRPGDVVEFAGLWAARALWFAVRLAATVVLLPLCLWLPGPEALVRRLWEDEYAGR